MGRAHDFGIILDDVSITELSFGKEYAAAVEAKQIAQQEAQRASYLVEKAVQEKQQKIVQAEGETAAARMLGECSESWRLPRRSPAQWQRHRTESTLTLAPSFSTSMTPSLIRRSLPRQNQPMLSYRRVKS